jgi:dolichol-phosphate mannosyltransferase
MVIDGVERIGGKETVLTPLCAKRPGLALRSLISWRFIRFCTVGFSGVVVNLGCLYLLHRQLGVHVNVASILAIETSILSNFLLNHFWTFNDRRTESQGFGVLALRFHMVSLIGGFIQFVIFVIMNMVWFLLTANAETRALFFATTGGWSSNWLWHALVTPPRVGGYTYISQLIGIGAATLWNFVVNNFWTWAGEGKATS